MTNQNHKPQKPEKKSGNEINIGSDVTNSVIIAGSGNKVHVIRSAPIIIIALFILILIVFFGNQFINIPLQGAAGLITETSTTSSTPTNTLLPGEPTLTPVPPTDTPTLTPSPIPPVSLGEDWMQGCVSKLWLAYPETIQPEDRGNGCWQEPIHAFSAENGDLDFLFERNSGAPEIYGLFAQLLESGSVTLTIRLKDLNNTDLMIGVFSQPDVYSQGLLMIMLNGKVEKNVFIQKDPQTYVTLQGTQNIEQGNGYSITFYFDNLSARSVINPAVFFTDSISIPSSQKWLFLGYKGLNGYYRIEGTFLNFELKP